jgi:hypothetical protein
VRFRRLACDGEQLAQLLYGVHSSMLLVGATLALAAVTAAAVLAVVPTMIAQRFFQPRMELGEADFLSGSSATSHAGDDEEEWEVAGALDR